MNWWKVKKVNRDSMVGIEVENIDDEIATLKSIGVKITSGPFGAPGS